jgi:hypothetical protein
MDPDEQRRDSAAGDPRNQRAPQLRTIAEIPRSAPRPSKGGRFRPLHPFLCQETLHLLQICLVYINTLMIQQILWEPTWMNMMKPRDLQALSPLLWSHVNPYGTFQLDMNERLLIETVT